MKKIISYIASVATIGNFLIPYASAEGITPNSVYADVNGVQAIFDQETVIDITSCSLTLNGVAVEGVFDYNDTNAKLSFTPTSNLECDSIYTLSVEGDEREFMIKTIFKEDFEGFDDLFISDTQQFDTLYGKYSITSTSNTDGSAMIKDGKLYLAGAKFNVDEFEYAMDKGFNLSADVCAYGKKYTTSSGSVGTANKSRATVYFNSNNNLGVAYKYKTMEIGYWAGDTFNKTSTSTSGSTYPTDNGEFPFDKVNNDTKQFGEPDYSELSFANEIYAKNISIYSDGNNVVGRTEDSDAVFLEDSLVDGSEIGIEATASTLAIVDNILLTTYTEDVAPPEEGELVATDIESSFTQMNLKFDRSLKGLKRFDGISVFKDDEDVTDSCTFTLNDDNTSITIVPEGKIFGYVYKIRVAEGFGTKLLYTYKDYDFTVELEKRDITIEKITGGKNSITVKLSEDISTVDVSDCVELYDSNGTVFASSTVADGDKLIITPLSSFVKNEVYEVYIHNIETEESILATPKRQAFKLETVYFNNFDDEVIGDGVAFGGSSVKRDDEGKTRLYSWRGTTVSITGGRPTVEEDVDISFDMWMYNACMMNSDKRYDDNMPFSLCEFNCDGSRYSTSVAGQQIYWSGTNLLFYNKLKGNSSVINQIPLAENWKVGDIYVENNVYTVLQNGDALPVPQTNKAGEDVLYSERDESPRYHIEFIKQGNKITMLKSRHVSDDYDDCSKDTFETYTFNTPSGNNPTTGGIYLTAQVTEAWAVDNFEIVMLTLIDNDGVEIKNASYSVAGGNANVSAKLLNYGENKLPLNVIVALYGDNSQLLSMKTCSLTSIDAYDSIEINETIPVEGTVKGAKIYALDGYSSLGVYSIKSIN